MRENFVLLCTLRFINVKDVKYTGLINEGGLLREVLRVSPADTKNRAEPCSRIGFGRIYFR